MTNIDKRLFYLMLSAVEGHEFSKVMGFSPTSEDVKEVEVGEILTRWAVMLHYGLLKEIEEATDWFTEFMVKTDKLTTDVDDFKSVLTVYAVATLNKLMESEKLAFVLPLGDEDE